MNYLLFPGRHPVNTVFQELYLQHLLTESPTNMPGFLRGSSVPASAPSTLLFAITSANQENSRFNPIPFHIRAIGVDRFARQIQQRTGCHYRILGIPITVTRKTSPHLP